MDQNTNYNNPQDTGSFGWAVLSFFFSLIGLILTLVWWKSRPNTAHMCLKGTVASVIFSFVIGIISGIMGAA